MRSVYFVLLACGVWANFFYSNEGYWPGSAYGQQRGRLEYIQYNENKPINIIFIHSSFGNAESLFGFARDPRIKAKANSWLISMPNHGNSYDPTRFSARSIAQDVKNLIDEHGLRNVYVVGHSLGAYVAEYMAAKWGSLVKGILALDYLPFGANKDELAFVEKAVGAFIKLDLKRPLAEIKTDFISIFGDPEFFDLVSATWEGTEGNYVNTANLQNYYNNIGSLLANQIPLKKYYGKFKLITGRQSFLYHPELFPKLADYYPNINLANDILVLESGHVVYARFLNENIQVLLDLIA